MVEQLVDPTFEEISGESERNIEHNAKRNLTREIAGTAIFSALSIALSYVATFIPRIPGWYIAWFDPISLIWISAFMIFGFRSGLITTLIGTIGLIPFDPTLWIGPTMKFLSTIWFVILPYFWLKIKGETLTHENLKEPRNYIPPMIAAWLIRIALMTFLNYIILKYMFNALDFMTLGWLGLDSTTGTIAVIVTVVFINTLQSVFDAALPYFIIFKTPIEDLLTVY